MHLHVRDAMFHSIYMQGAGSAAERFQRFIQQKTKVTCDWSESERCTSKNTRVVCEVIFWTRFCLRKF